MLGVFYEYISNIVLSYEGTALDPYIPMINEAAFLLSLAMIVLMFLSLLILMRWALLKLGGYISIG